MQLRSHLGRLARCFEQFLKAVVISKNVNKGGSTHNHAHSLGVAQLQPRPYFQRWKHDNTDIV